MPDLNFKVIGVEALSQSLTPLLQFKLEVKNEPSTETIQAVLLHAQIQIQSAARGYTTREKEKLSELFGSPDRWGQTLRNRLWTHAQANVGPFSGSTQIVLTVPCSYDLNLAATKYFYGLEEGEIVLLFLFSGSVFYVAEDGRIQVGQISWNKECSYRMPVRFWQELIEGHYPQSAWIYLNREVFDRLYAFKRQHG